MNKHTKALYNLSILISPVIGDNTELKNIIISEDTPWDEIIDFANQHLLIPTLCESLKQKNLIQFVKNELMVEYLETVYDINRIRNENILIQLQDISNLFLEIGIKPILLKGASSLSEGHYNGIGERMMSDIDILVPEDRILECIELLESKGGYQPIDSEEDFWTEDGHHYRRIHTENGVAALELHRYCLGKGYQYLSNSRVMENVRESKIIKNALVMEPTFELYHAFLHSEISDISYENYVLMLRHLHQAAVIATKCKDEIDWTLLEKEVEKYEVPEKELKKYQFSSVWSAYLYALNRLFRVDVPAEMIGDKEHFEKILFYMDNYSSKDAIVALNATNLKRAFSYEKLKKEYHLKSKFGYPLALTKHIFKLFSKYMFSSEARKELFEYINNHVKSRQYGQ